LKMLKGLRLLLQRFRTLIKPNLVLQCLDNHKRVNHET